MILTAVEPNEVQADAAKPPSTPTQTPLDEALRICREQREQLILAADALSDQEAALLRSRR